MKVDYREEGDDLKCEITMTPDEIREAAAQWVIVTEMIRKKQHLDIRNAKDMVQFIGFLENFLPDGDEFEEKGEIYSKMMS